MNILINASNLKKGGGLQVADSFLKDLYKYKWHNFVVVYPKVLEGCAEEISKYENIECFLYDISIGIRTFITGRDLFLDDIVERKIINTVLTIFGPSIWKPRVPHVCGFARAQVVLDDSPYWEMVSILVRIKYFFRRPLLIRLFEKSSNSFWTESEYISRRLRSLLPRSRVYTVTNNYNQIFDQSDKWDRSIVLPKFEGLTLLTISANYPHKNLKIIVPAIAYLKEKHPDVKFRFVLTVCEDEMLRMPQDAKEYVVFLGPVSIEQCPYLYEQCDVMFLPTLMECFSASYAEAMRMGKPILTTDLEFSRSICCDAAEYYDAVSPQDLGEAIYRMIKDADLYQSLIEKGKTQLGSFDNYEERTRKLIEVVEREYQLQQNENA